METRKGKVTALNQENGDWAFEISVLTPAWKFSHAEIVLPGEEIDLDLLFQQEGDPEHEETHVLSGLVQTKPSFVVGDEVKVRFT
jgi:hypothetical protein